MSDAPGSNAERSLAICSLFESEVLVWLLLRNWDHPRVEDDDFRNRLLETATAVLDEAATGPQYFVFIEGVPTADMNLIAAVWYAENLAVADSEARSGDDHQERIRWLEAVRRTLPSCFCPQDRLA